MAVEEVVRPEQILLELVLLFIMPQEVRRIVVEYGMTMPLPLMEGLLHLLHQTQPLIVAMVEEELLVEQREEVELL